MSNLIIEDKTSKMGVHLPHKIFLGGGFLGILKGQKALINNIPAGSYVLRVESMIPFIYAQQTIVIKEGENQVSFHDRERVWDCLLWFDVVIVLLRWLIELPKQVDLCCRVISNVIFVAWIIYEYIIRKRYFRFVQKN